MAQHTDVTDRLAIWKTCAANILIANLQVALNFVEQNEHMEYSFSFELLNRLSRVIGKNSLYEPNWSTLLTLKRDFLLL